MRQCYTLLFGLALMVPAAVKAQIDPDEREYIQFGYNQPLEGKGPLAAYAFYLRNQPGFIQTNLTLRLAIAPTYIDSELGVKQGLGPNTDYGVGIAGGGFADSFNEVDGGKYMGGQSFDGDSAQITGSLYHLFNPQDRIPLSFVFHASAHESVFIADDETAPDFRVPNDMAILDIRTGLRYGGFEPTLFPDLAMELAVWYDGQIRSEHDTYGYNNDREVEPSSHLFWASAGLSYTLPKSKQNFYGQLVAGTSLDADRLSAYRMGGYLPLIAEYPLSIPGYYYQEFSARQFVLLNARYILPLVPDQEWNLQFDAATAVIDYLPGTGQAGNWDSGVGAGIMYRSVSGRYKVVANYGYGINAIRDSGRGASTINLMVQIDLGKFRGENFRPEDHWRITDWLLGR